MIDFGLDFNGTRGILMTSLLGSASPMVLTAKKVDCISGFVRLLEQGNFQGIGRGQFASSV